jgi:PrtD family type I secretion system ABC transporter
MNASGHNAKAIAFAGHSLANADTVEAMGMLPGLKQHWMALHDSGLELQAQASDRAGILTAMTKFIRPVLQIAILGVGAYLVLAQEILPGAMIAGSIMMGRALAPVEGAIGNWRSFVMARSAFQRVLAVLSEPAPKTSKVKLPRPTGVLSVEKLVATAPGGQVPIIKGISFAAEAGKVLGIVGPSAAGKSTLARLLVGVWAPASGHVRLDGADVYTWNHAELGAHIGYLSQEVDLFEGTVLQNIARFGEDDSKGVIAAAKQAGVHDLILRLPDGYDTLIGVGGMVLSGGQRQRIGLARAVYGNPAFVVLDEPNSNLDQQGELALAATIRDLRKQGTSVVFIAHRSALVKIADNILVMNEGKIAHYGPRDEVLAALSPAPMRSRENPVHRENPVQRENPVHKQFERVGSALRSA